MQSFQKSEFRLEEKKNYDKLFPELKPLIVDDKALRALSDTMIDHECAARDSEVISNGLSIFGQFLAHDMTFEVTSKFRGYNQIESFVNDRTIRMDLDCLYGQWNQDFLYDKYDRDKLLLGERFEKGKYGWYDLQRNEQDKAIIPDARNDENIIVSQMQVLFIHFHNRMVDYMRKKLNKKDVFQEARGQVIWYYHWLILHEYLYKITDWSVFEDILENGPWYFENPVYLPLEFTGAAFRTGHSQTRENNRISEYTEKDLFQLGAFERMDEYLDWRYLFDFDDGKVQYARLIDTKISEIFHDIPFIKSHDRYERSLPYRNMKRGEAYGLASGEDIARRMCIEPIDIAETKDLPGTPLWYYILKESEILGHKGEHMGPVGSRLLLECFLAILNGDQYSFQVLHPKWKPEIGRSHGEFDFVDLVEFAMGDS